MGKKPQRKVELKGGWLPLLRDVARAKWPPAPGQRGDPLENLRVSRRALDNAVRDAEMTEALFFRVADDLDMPQEELRAVLGSSSVMAAPDLQNEPDLAAFCGRLSKYAIDRLASAGLFQRGRTIIRDGFRKDLAGFMASEKSVLALVGDSGVGKTSALALTAESIDEGLPPRLLLRGADISPGQEGLPALLERLALHALREAAPRGGWTSRLRGAAGQPPLVLLDGLNEATASVEEICNRWLPDSLTWIAENRVKLVVTCRPYHWRLVERAIPAELLYAPGAPALGQPSIPPRNVDGKREVEMQPAKGRIPENVIRLGDFSPAEASAAVAAYGLGHVLSPRDAAHPFVLAIAETIGPDGDFSSIAGILEMFIQRKVQRALGRLGRPVWDRQVLDALDDIAAEMLRTQSQVIWAGMAAKLFDRHVEAIDSLVEESLLQLDDQGYRFQHDQVRELLQAKRVDLRAARTCIDTQPLRSAIDLLANRPFGIFAVMLLLATRGFKAIVLSARGHKPVPPSVATFVLLRALAEGPSEECQEVLDGLFAATEPKRMDEGANWAGDVIVSLLTRMGASGPGVPMLNEWMRRLVTRDDPHWYSDRSDLINGAIADALRRSDLPVETRLEFVPLLFLQERATEWWSPSLVQRGLMNHESLVEATKANPTALLVEALAAADGDKTLQALGRWLDDERGLGRKNIRGFWRVPVGCAASVCLFYLGKSHPGAQAAALRSTSYFGRDLVEAIARSDASSLVEICMAELSVSKGKDLEHYGERLWSCARHSVAWPTLGRLLGWCEAHTCHGAGALQLWSARVLLEKHRSYSLARALHPEALGLGAFLEYVAGTAGEASRVVERNLFDVHCAVLKHDYMYLLEHRFEETERAIEVRAEPFGAADDVIIAGLIEYTSPVLSRTRPNGPERLRRVVNLLDRYLDKGGADAAASMAGFAIGAVDAAGINDDYYFSLGQVQESGLLKLALKVIKLGDARSHAKLTTLVRPENPATSLLYEAVRDQEIAAHQIEKMMTNILIRTREGANLTKLSMMRTEAHRDGWDRGVIRYLMVSNKDARKYYEFWKILPADSQSATSKEFLDWIEAGASLEQAASGCSRNDMGKRLLKGELRRMWKRSLERAS